MIRGQDAGEVSYSRSERSSSCRRFSVSLSEVKVLENLPCQVIKGQEDGEDSQSNNQISRR